MREPLPRLEHSRTLVHHGGLVCPSGLLLSAGCGFAHALPAPSLQSGGQSLLALLAVNSLSIVVWGASLEGHSSTVLVLCGARVSGVVVRSCGVSAEADSVAGTPRLKRGCVKSSSRSVSWSYAAADGGVCGDLHHHGAHPEVPGREQAADSRNSGQPESGKAERVCHVSSEAAAESDVPCSHRRCTTPSEPELSSGPSSAAHATIAAVYSAATAAATTAATTTTTTDDEPTKLSSTVHATKPGCVTAVAAVVPQPARRGCTGKLGHARDD